MVRSDTVKGLTETEVKRARETYGENRLSQKKQKNFFMSFLESFGDPMIKILLIALIINLIFLFHESNWFESIGIAVAILLATLVSTLSEYGSESAFEKLQEEASRIQCKVKRRGGVAAIPVDQVVVGDVVLLQAGDKVPADGVLLTGNLDVDQSSLNGESKEAAKSPCKASSRRLSAAECGMEGASDDFMDPRLLFSPSIVCAGEGLMRVTAVGDKTVYGRIGREVQEETRESPLKLRLGNLAAGIGKFGYMAALFTAITYLFNAVAMDAGFEREAILRILSSPNQLLGYVIKACTLAVTVIVMAVPEGLPMMITVVLSANMKRMLKDNVLVRKLTGIETAGSLNILFTDKTGTLTHGRLDVTHFVSGSGKLWSNRDISSSRMALRDILYESLFYNNSSLVQDGKPIGGNATDRALLAFALGFRGVRRSRLRKGMVLPFTSDAKFMATAVSGDQNVTFVKGAPEKILPYCREYCDEQGKALPLTRESPIHDAVLQLSAQAIRIVAVAISDDKVTNGRSLGNLRLVGIVGIRDEIRREAVTGVRLVQNAGIQTVMITGDSRLTAFAIANEIGLIKHNDDVVLTSEELRAMSDRSLLSVLPNLRVVARALPSDKSRLVRIAQAKGLVVGMTGDGVNDAPALKQADIGFAMGSGTEIAKEAGDIVILNDNFNSIAKAVCYGRTIFKSIRKFIIYQMSICMCAVTVTVVGPLIGVDFPITVIQMLWINIVMDTLAGLAFSGEKARVKYMKEPPKSRDEPILNPYMRGQIAVNSVYSAGLSLFFLKHPYIQNLFEGHGEVYRMTAFFSLFMFSAIFTSFCARTHMINLMDYLAGNKPFLLIMGAVTAIQVSIVYYGGGVFRTVGLEAKHLVLTVVLAFSIIPVDLARKLLVEKYGRHSGT